MDLLGTILRWSYVQSMPFTGVMHEIIHALDYAGDKSQACCPTLTSGQR